MNVRTNLLLPKDLVDRVDAVAGPRGRSRYVAAAIEKQLRRDLWHAAAEATIGIWRDHPLFPTDESVVAWVRAGRAKERDTPANQS